MFPDSLEGPFYGVSGSDCERSMGCIGPTRPCLLDRSLRSVFSTAAPGRHSDVLPGKPRNLWAHLSERPRIALLFPIDAYFG